MNLNNGLSFFVLEWASILRCYSFIPETCHWSETAGTDKEGDSHLSPHKLLSNFRPTIALNATNILCPLQWSNNMVDVL